MPGPVDGATGVCELICPACDHRVSFAQSFGILNPFNFPCPDCKSRLTVGTRGRIVLVAAVIFGLSLCAIAIFMEEAGRRETRESLQFTALALIVGGLPAQYFGISFADAQIKRISGSA